MVSLETISDSMLRHIQMIDTRSEITKKMRPHEHETKNGMQNNMGVKIECRVVQARITDQKYLKLQNA